MSSTPTMLVLACRDDVIRRGSASILFDVRSLTPLPRSFDRFVLDVAAALERAQYVALAAEARKAAIDP